MDTMDTKELYKKIDNTEYSSVDKDSYFNGGLMLVNKNNIFIKDNKFYQYYEIIEDYETKGIFEFDIKEKYFQMIQTKIKYLSNMSDLNLLSDEVSKILL